MEHSFLSREDEDVAHIIQGEEQRERDGLELIPSENYASRAVREASASVLTNKYAEGYPGKRYYGGQKFTDGIETLAIERAKELFRAEYANVQPLGGANANLATYFALMQPGDTILGMDLSHGGHLTHGHPITISANLFNFVRYGMEDADTGVIDYDALQKIAEGTRPKVLLAGFSAYPRTLDWERLADIAHSVGAVAVADVAHIAGLIVGGVADNPFTHGFDVMTTTTHKTLRGPRGGLILTRENSAIAKKIDKAVFPGLQGGPHMHQIAAKAVCFKEALDPSFGTYASHILENAQAMAEVFVHEGARLITGGTDNHMLLLDAITSFNMSGADAERILDSVGITLNKNVIADDVRSAHDPSGIRFGTPALTTRGFTRDACCRVATLMCTVLRHPTDETITVVHEEIRALAHTHPIPDSYV